MNNLYNSIYSRHYDVLKTILDLASEPIGESEIRRVIMEHGFKETAYELMQELKRSNLFGLLEKTSNGYQSVVSKLTTYDHSLNEYRWLKSILSHNKIDLFISDSLQNKLQDLLEDVSPLYDLNLMKQVDAFEQRHSVNREHYKSILLAIKSSKALRIHYESNKGNRHHSDFLPIDLIYSMKADKFQLSVVGLTHYINQQFTFNLEGIQSLELIDYTFENIDIPECEKDFVDIEIFDLRNGFERCFFQLSMYERKALYDEKTGTCRMRLYFNKDRQTEVLITLMSFGPAIKVLGPDEFKLVFLDRLKKQYSLSVMGGHHEE